MRVRINDNNTNAVYERKKIVRDECHGELCLRSEELTLLKYDETGRERDEKGACVMTPDEEKKQYGH